MEIDIKITSVFAKDFKRLSKKYRSLRENIALLQDELLENPYIGTKIADTFYKIRIQIKSKGKGKSGGGRVISHVREENEAVLIVLIKLYDKSDQSSVKIVELRQILEDFEEEE